MLGRTKTALVCLQESRGSLLQGPLAHAGLLGTRIIEGTNSLMTRRLQVMKTSKEFDFVFVADVRAGKRRHQPHLRKLVPGRRPEETAALQLAVRAPLTREEAAGRRHKRALT